MSRELRGTGNVYLRNKTWWFYYWGGKKLHRVSSHSRSKKEALRQLSLHVSEKTKTGGRVILRNTEQITLADLLNRLRTHYDANDAQPNSRRALERAAAHLTAFFGSEMK